MIRSPLVQVRQWLSPEDLQTFYKFVRITYKLNGDISISK